MTPEEAEEYTSALGQARDQPLPIVALGRIARRMESEGRSHAEIASALGVSPGRLIRAVALSGAVHPRGEASAVATPHVEPNVYVIQAGENGPVKIGVAANVKARMAELQCAQPEPLRVLAVIPNGGRAVEQTLHGRLRGSRIRGEWFVWGADVEEAIRDLTT